MPLTDTDIGTRHPVTRCERRWRNILCLGLLLTGCGGPSDPESLLERAREAQARGELRAAWIETRNVLVAEPDHAEARLLMGELQLAVGAAAEAEKELRRARELGIPAARSELLLIRSVLVQGRNDDVIDLTEADELPEEVEPADHANLLGLRAQAQYALGELEAAAATATTALDLDPGASEAVLARAMMQVRANELDAAAAALDANLQEHPDFAAGWHLRGDIHRLRGEVDGAIAAYARAAANSRTNTVDLGKHALALVAKGDDASLEAALADAAQLARSAPDHAAAGFIRGMVALKRNQPAAARDALLEALAREPEHAPTQLNLGRAHLMLGEHQQALEQLTSFLRSYPTSREGGLLLAGLQLRLDNPAAAAAALEPVAARDVEDRPVLEMLAAAYMGLGRLDEARAIFQRLAKAAPGTASEQARLGAALMASGDPESGLALLDEAILSVPEDAPTRERLLGAMLSAGNAREATRTAEHFLEAHPDDLGVRRMLALARTLSGDAEAARVEWQAVLEQYPGDPSANHALADIDIRQGRYDDARARFEAVLATNPGHERTLITLAELDLRSGRRPQAIERLESMRKASPDQRSSRMLLARVRLEEGRPADARTLMNEVRAEDRGDEAWYLLTARIQRALDKRSEWVESLEQLVRLKPESAGHAFHLAEAYAATGRSEESRKLLARALELDPDFLPALVARLRGLAISGEEAEADALLADLERRFPDSLEVRAQSGWLAARRNDPATALAQLEKAYRTRPTGALLRDIANAKLQLGQTDAALSLFDEWLGAHPEDTIVRTQHALVLLGLGRGAEAIEALRAVVEQRPSDPMALNNLAWALTESAPQEALELAERAQSLAPDNAAVLDTLARARSASNDHRGAERLLRDALLHRPGHRDLQVSLARVLISAGDPQGARAALKAALEDAPDHEDARRLLNEIGS